MSVDTPIRETQLIGNDDRPKAFHVQFFSVLAWKTKTITMNWMHHNRKTGTLVLSFGCRKLLHHFVEKITISNLA